MDGLVLAIYSLREMVKAEHDSTREYMLTLANHIVKEKPATVSPKLIKKSHGHGYKCYWPPATNPGGQKGKRTLNYSLFV